MVQPCAVLPAFSQLLKLFPNPRDVLELGVEFPFELAQFVLEFVNDDVLFTAGVHEFSLANDD
jgi:hypothetical protein